MKMVSTRHGLVLLVMIGLVAMAHAQNTTAARTLSGGQVREQIINHKGQDLSKDTDGDGISDFLEVQIGTDPNKADSDGDGTPDGIEVAHGLDPTVSNPAPDFVYIVNRLAVPSGYKDGALGSEISNTGIVAGTALTHSTTSKDSAVRWITTTGAVDVASNAVNSYGWAVSDNGVIAGKYNWLALYWAPGNAARSVNRSSDDTNYASGINSSGKIVGYLNSQFPGDTGAFAWEDSGNATGTFTHLPAPSGYRYPRAEAINDKNQIVGVAFSVSTSQKAAVIWNGVTASVIPSAAGTTEAAFDDAWSINQNGAVLGYKDNRPAVWTPAEGRKYLPTGAGGLSASARDINAFGEVLGTLDYKPTLWRPDGTGGWNIIDVNSKILDATVMTSFRGGGMNDAGQITGYYYDAGKYVPVVLTPIMRPSLAVDANRDGVIKLASENGSDATSATQPYRIWVNDDGDKGDTGGADIPFVASTGGVTRNCDDFSINGARDLIDWFPVFFDIKSLVQKFVPSFVPGDGGVRYKLKQSDGAVKVVFTSLARTEALKYQTQDMDAVYGGGIPLRLNSSLADARVFYVSPDGIDLFSQLRDLYHLIVNQSGCVLLVEGVASTTEPLVLALERPDGTLIAELKLELTISPVEQMFRHLNLRDGADAPQGNGPDGLPKLVGEEGDGHAALPTAMSEPRNHFPDELGEPNWLFFVHGYNVSGLKARGWNAEMFKRFYWSGNKARFVGVTWFGNPATGGSNIVQGYHWAVRNAVPTAQLLADQVNILPGIKTIVGHSQGCWVSSVAVADFGMDVANLCLIDAALARECFDGDGATDVINMVPSTWRDYPSWSWSANWHQLFDREGGASDARSQLKWKGRLTEALSATTVYSFFSSTEDVLERYTGTPTAAVVENAFRAVSNLDSAELGRFAWVCQEKTKGDKALFTQGSGYGGWGFNLHDGMLSSHPKWYVPVTQQPARRVKTPEEIGSASAALLEGARYNPLFKSGWGRFEPQSPAREIIETNPVYNTGPEWVIDLYQAPSGSATANLNRTQLLAEAIPALSLPVGANETVALGENNFNMPEMYASPERWPDDRGVDSVSGRPFWHHSDIREVAYPYLHELFDKIVKLSARTP